MSFESARSELHVFYNIHVRYICTEFEEAFKNILKKILKTEILSGRLVELKTVKETGAERRRVSLPTRGRALLIIDGERGKEKHLSTK